MRLPTPDDPLKIGTRASPLALAQAYETRHRLMRAHDLPETAFAIVAMTTSGDRALEKKLGEIGGKGLFTKEVEEALYDGSADIAVHSMKDMPTESPPGLTFGAFLEREDPRDAFVSLTYDSIEALPPGGVVGTASLRRRAQLLNMRPDLSVILFRGSVQRRLDKLRAGEADATFLAMAGLTRLGLLDAARGPIEMSEMLPAAAQGAIGVQYREADAEVGALLKAIDHAPTRAQLDCERAFLAALDGSCRTPIGGYARIEGERMIFRGEILKPDGSLRYETRREGPVVDAARLGREAGEELARRAGPGFFVEV